MKLKCRVHSYSAALLGLGTLFFAAGISAQKAENSTLTVSVRKLVAVGIARDCSM